jgi:hypothetical protein
VASFFVMIKINLLYLINDGPESLRVVDSEVGKHLTVDFYSCLVESTHECGVAHILEACGSVDTLNPQRAEVAFLVTAVTISVGETLLPSVLRYRPNILSCTIISLGEFQDSGSLCFRSNMIY